MALTPSNMLPLGTKAPSFNLLDSISGETLALNQLRGDLATVVMFICNHCPYVIHLHEGLTNLIEDYKNTGVSIIAISSNDVDNYPQDGPIEMKKLATQLKWNIPYLFDESQEVAKAYEAACTPDFYIFNNELSCTYRGQFDASRPGNSVPVTGKDLRNAIDSTINNRNLVSDQIPSMGCNIKWKA